MHRRLRVWTLACLAFLAAAPAYADEPVPGGLGGTWLAEDIGGNGVIDDLQTTLEIKPEKGARLRVLRWKRFVQADEDLWLENTRKFSEKYGIEPMASPRNSVTTLASSSEEAFVSRSTTPDSRIRLPSISMPISGVANGTSTPTTSVTTMGNSTRVRRLIARVL